MTTAKSLAMVVPAARRGICNELMDALKRGPNTFSVALAAQGPGDVVAYGAHTYDDDLAEAIVNGQLPPGITLTDLQAHGFTAASARTALGYIRYRIIDGRRAKTNFASRLAQDSIEVTETDKV